jgi:L-seryl-tRNA(Ser) seleniumtransferase
MKQSQLRAIPSVEKLLYALGDTEVPRPMALEVVRREVASLRKQKTIPGFDAVLAAVRKSLRELRATRVQPLINGTGILVHTNFGRSPLGATVIETLSNIGGNYNNLEYGLIDGARGGRAAYLEQSLAILCGAEAATVVNNNAAALVLILRHFCQSAGASDQRSASKTRKTISRKDEVIISRGELVQIGGGFRIPDILETSGARLREVGTTNKTSLSDYTRAIGPATAMILKVHRSNFFMDGFVDSPPGEEIAALARKKRVPFVEDLGSGAMIETESVLGLEHEPTPAGVIRRGVDLVCFSGDKLLGGPQAGIIAGKAKMIGALKRDPFFRALRCDKLILSALEATADIYLRGLSGEDRLRAGKPYADVPVIQMMHLSTDALLSRAEKIVSGLEGLAITVRVGEGRSQIGGGTLPRSAIASVTIDLTHSTLKPQEIATRLRDHTVPVIGYIDRGKLKLDLRTVFPRQDAEVVEAIRSLSR